MLSDRRQRVLAALIEEYVVRALPVGSRTLTERYHLGVSSATVRNELSMLEDEGYISQPHTSAGRIPTDIGYRAFVDDLIESGSIVENEQTREAVERLKSEATELDDLIDRTTNALARVTDCLSIVLTAPVLASEVQQITLVSMSDHRAVIVIVTKDGNVLNHQVEFTQKVSADELAQVQNLINELFDGRKLNELKAESINESLPYANNQLLKTILDEIGVCLKDNELVRRHQVGVGALMRKPEFASSEALLPIMQVLEDDTVLIEFFDEATHGWTVPSVRIGRENASENLSGVSVVASPYGRGEGAGVVAVIGPTRMDYSKVLRAVRVASQALNED